VVIVLHGGCWLSAYDLGYISGLAAALADDGIATWSLEYRRVGDDGGGWPGTFTDVGLGADHLRTLAAPFDLDLDRVVAVGHSAGGHLALWLAARPGLGPDDELRGADPLHVTGAVALAGIADLADYASPEGCGSAVAPLLGGEPAEVPERVPRVSPIERVPLGVPQHLIVGGLDPIVPLEHVRRYADRARAAGDHVEVTVISEVGHFEPVAPHTGAFGIVRDAVRAAVWRPRAR
jgi:acetyl esterase/lipase